MQNIVIYCFNFPSWAWGFSCCRTPKFFQSSCLLNTFLIPIHWSFKFLRLAVQKRPILGFQN